MFFMRACFVFLTPGGSYMNVLIFDSFIHSIIFQIKNKWCKTTENKGDVCDLCE